MRRPAIALPTAVLLAAMSLSAAAARADLVGASVAPSAPLAGGSQYGVRSSLEGPVVAQLSVPRAAVPGPPPRVTLMLQEQRVGTVNVQVSINSLVTRRPVVVARLGWVHTGRLLSVRWPAGARLATGPYHVSVSAHDHRGEGIRRSAHSSGVATLTVAEMASPSPPSGGEVPVAGVPTPAQTVLDGALFPVAGAHSFGNGENRYGAARSGYLHEGQDVLAAEGSAVIAPLPGTITVADYQAGGAGYYAVERTALGFDLMFAHCKAASLTVAAGAPVSAGQPLCEVGQTGDATGPHLHLEMWVGGWRTTAGHSIDPLPYLEAWQQRAG